MRIYLFVCLLLFSEAFLEESFDIDILPDKLGISDECTLYSDENATVLRFHNLRPALSTSRVSEIYALNNKCDMVLFGYPHENTVVIWKPFEDLEINITREDAITPNSGIFVDRFGFSVDIKDHTWVVGAPGTPNTHENNYQGATMGYAFVFDDTELHACRSLFDTYCFPLGTECLTAAGGPGVKNTKDYYKFLKEDERYKHVFGDEDIDIQIKDRELFDFQKVCISPQNPYYATGPLNPVRIPYFEFQQFGYSVALTGEIGTTGSALFISAPGDTNRFMEDNDGKNYGRVYMWDSVVWKPNNESLPDLTWWSPSVFMPIIPPNLAGATYRGFGRAIAASRSNLAVSTYPLYDNTREPFIIIYDCSESITTFSDCQESENRGISVDKLPGNVLGYMTRAMLKYTDGKTGLPYIPAFTKGDNLIDFQNDFIGKHIGVTGSNVIVSDKRYNKVYRYGNDSRKREIHPYHGNTHFGSNTQHWVLQNHKQLTHYWNCPLGTVGPKKNCEYNDALCIRAACIPCEKTYYSTDGYLDDCEICRVNFTTYEEGMYYCDPWYPPLPDGLLWSDASFMIYIILGAITGAYGVFLCWEYSCSSKRTKRKFPKGTITI